MRVCHIVNIITDKNFTLDFCTALALESEVEPTVIPLHKPANLNEEPPFEVIELDYNNHLLSRINYVRKLSKDFDIVHTHHNRSGAWIELVTTRTPTVTTQHNAHHGYHRLSRLLNGITNPLADAVVCVSESVRNSFYRWENTILSDNKIHVIQNGAPLHRIDAVSADPAKVRRKYGIPLDSVLVGSAGMHTKQKGYDTLIEAIAGLVQNSNQEVHLVLPGDGPETQSIEELAEELGISDYVHFPGFLPERTDVYRLMIAMDIFAMPSRWEGLSIAALEALALGIPCVFADIPAFQPFSDVAIFHPVNDAAELELQLNKLAEMEQFRMKLGMKGSDFVRNQYTLNITAKKYCSLYHNLVNKE